ncbi:MAG: hypothetical protein CMJ18_06165 [Phycisphaeraceae bacterium]|nr:hypothetical protein [Phycisphaeraceae bacterium]
MARKDAHTESFLNLFLEGDVEGATRLLQRQSDAAARSDYKAHPLLKECVDRNDHDPVHRLGRDRLR